MDYAELDDADLLRAYRTCEGEPGCEDYDAIVAEIERRGLDI
jgi:hypothetical protein